MFCQSTTRLLLAVSLSTLLVSIEAAAQETTSPAPESGYFEEIAVDIVNVEVYVTDKEGNPVNGLTIQDFSVLEDGRPVELLNFYAVSKGRPTSLGEPIADKPVDPLAEPQGDLDEPAYPEEQRLNLIIYVDNLFIHPLDRIESFHDFEASCTTL